MNTRIRDRFPFALTSLLLTLSLAGCGGGAISTDEAPKAALNPEFAAAAGVPQQAGIEFRKSPVKRGDAAPAMALAVPDQKGVSVSVSELTLSRDALLVFYAGEASPEARPIYDWVRRNRAFVAQQGAEVVLINSTDDRATNERVAAVEDLKVAVLGDYRAVLARAYGLVQPYTAPSLERTWSVVVGKGGVVLSAEPGLPSTTDLVTTLKVEPRPEGGFTVLDMIRE